MYFNNLEWLFSNIFPELEWSVPSAGKEIYLTFDDGPIPGVTEFVLDQLTQYEAKATFFCVGDNVGKHPEIFQKIIAGGHRVGNHTYNHLNGWKNDLNDYLENVAKCDAILKRYGLNEVKKKLFRPPYGKISRNQIKMLKEEYRIIMWNVLTGDYDAKLSSEECLKKALKYTNSGSVVIFHDSVKAEKNLKAVLPGYLRHFSSLGYSFKSL